MPDDVRALFSILLVIVIVRFCGCASETERLDDSDSDSRAGDVGAQSTNAGTDQVDAGDELSESELEISPAPAPASIDAEVDPVSVRLNVDCYGLGSAEGIRKVAVAYDDCEDKTSTLAASRIALLAKLLIDVWGERKYPELDQLRKHLSAFKVVSVHYESGTDLVPEFARLKFPDLYAEDPELALEKLGAGDAFCKPNGDPRYVDIGNEYAFFFVVSSTILTEGWADIVLHEIGHAALFSVYRDADPNHERDDFWLNHSDVTVMSGVLDRYYKTY